MTNYQKLKCPVKFAPKDVILVMWSIFVESRYYEKKVGSVRSGLTCYFYDR